MTTGNTKVIFHDLAHRQFDNNAPFTSWNCDNEDILLRVSDAIYSGDYKEGNVEGSMIVSIDPENIFTPVVKLEVGQNLVGTYEPRRGTEYPIKSVNAKMENGESKLPAKSCEAIVYLIDGDYSIVSVNGSPEETPTPINALTLLRNYFKIGAEQSHGTNLTWEELEPMLKESVIYWDDKAMMA
mgnify:CR=1 FL=1|tara:strand:- start:2172 stop:2723 length:552 start_codon:yes stop_codon:yes gene_type:complete